MAQAVPVAHHSVGPSLRRRLVSSRMAGVEVDELELRDAVACSGSTGMVVSGLEGSF